MDIEHVYYWFATFAMATAILFFISMIVLLFYIKQKVSDVDAYVKHVVRKVDNVMEKVNDQVRSVTNFKSMILGKSSK
jgi:hypothetical protein